MFWLRWQSDWESSDLAERWWVSECRKAVLSAGDAVDKALDMRCFGCCDKGRHSQSGESGYPRPVEAVVPWAWQPEDPIRGLLALADLRSDNRRLRMRNLLPDIER